MATADNTAPSSPVGAAATARQHTPSNISSPLSDVEDKDADVGVDEMDLVMQNQKSSSLSNITLDDDDDEPSVARSRSPSENEDSNLSEVDVNDSEAETERLYNTPPKAANSASISGSSWDAAGGPGKHFLATRDRGFEHSPSKLKQQLRIYSGVENGSGGGDDDESLSGHEGDSGHEEGEDDNVSEASSGSAFQTAAASNGEDNSSVSGREALAERVDSAAAALSALVSDGRKRKRSPVADLSESDQPLRKRTGSVGKNGRSAGEEDASASPPSGDHSEPDEDAAIKMSQKEEQDGAVDEGVRTRKSKRYGANTHPTSIEDGRDEEEAGATSDRDQGTGLPGPDETARADDDLLEVDPDEEAEAANKNEEERTSNGSPLPPPLLGGRPFTDTTRAVERKKAAFEQLQAIERHFAMFRERLVYHSPQNPGQGLLLVMGRLTGCKVSTKIASRGSTKKNLR